jgi:hypothetical protein
MTAKPLTDFLTKLEDDPKALASFRKDPDAAAKAAGLSAQQSALVLSRDPKTISAAVIQEWVGDPAGGQHVMFTWHIVIVIHF